MNLHNINTYYYCIKTSLLVYKYDSILRNLQIDISLQIREKTLHTSISTFHVR